MADILSSYKFLVAAVGAVEFRIDAYSNELSKIDPNEDDRRGDIQNDVRILEILSADLKDRLNEFIRTARIRDS